MLNVDEVIEKKAQFFFPNAMHFYKDPPLLVKGEGCILYDDQGNAFVDFFAGVTVVNCGHCNNEINEKVKKQLDLLQHTSIIYLTQAMVNLAEKLASYLPGDINKTFFCCSGTEANEGAMLLARMYTQKKGFLSFEGGLHGRSALTMSVTGIPMWRIDPFLDPDVYFAKGYMTDTNTRKLEASQKSLDSVEEILKLHGNQIAACIVEPMQGNGGMNVPDKQFFTKLMALLKAYNVLLIVDEVQTGFARTGKMFAIEHFGIVPDIITMAKALGNGYPIGAFSARPHIAKSFNKPSASTLGGNPVSMTAGLAVLDYIKENELLERASILGVRLMNGLRKLALKYHVIVDVRGLGLMIGLEMTTPEHVDYILEDMKDRGFIIGKNGIKRNVIAFQPPLVVSDEQIDDMLNALEQSLISLLSRHIDNI